MFRLERAYRCFSNDTRGSEDKNASSCRKVQGDAFRSWETRSFFSSAIRQFSSLTEPAVTVIRVEK